MKRVVNTFVSIIKSKKFLIGLMVVVEMSFFILINVLFYQNDNQQYVLLAKSFIEKKLYFTSTSSNFLGWGDSALFNGNYYWPLGVFPALILLPFVYLFGTGFLQGFISVPLTILNLYLLYKIGYHITGKREVSLVLAFSYIFSSAYAAPAYFALSWWFAHVVYTTCILLFLYFIFPKFNPFLSGIFFAFGFLTRLSLIFGIIFFPLYLFFFRREKFLKSFYMFMVPVVFGIFLFCLYNFLRFGSISETGYTFQILPNEIVANRDLGMWSFKHFPINVYIFFFKGLNAVYIPNSFIVKSINPDDLGLSFFLTSPIFLFVFLADIKKKLNVISALAAVSIAFFLFGSFGTGAWQYGYRFALDFQPFLYLLLLDYFKDRDVSRTLVVFIFVSFVFNLSMSLTFLYNF